MSEPKLISPMLDDFEMGGPISDHDGVCCCPAMRKNSDDKYIVKIISVPASEAKLEALLLAGVYPDKNAACSYFKQIAEEIVSEKNVLDKLAQLEGFVSYDDCQIVPKEDSTGYDVYLLSKYRMTLERQNLRNPMTQLAALNLGLDLCSALEISRRSGYMLVDLKPSNIYVIGDKEYRIGDLGFVRLNSLKYASLPDKYRSCYTAPEAEDAFAALSTTMDIYAAGLILYQVFNDGKLPFDSSTAPAEVFDAPAFADEEMSEIILKACAPDPSARWESPVLMGQALVNYMQKNGVNDTPLTAEFFGVSEEAPADEEDAEPLGEDQNLEPEATEETAFVTDESNAENSEQPDEEVQETSVEQTDQTQQDEEEEDDNYQLILSEFDDVYEGISEEASEILGQIEELTAHKVPDPVVAPEPIEIKMPEPIVPEPVVEDPEVEEPVITDSPMLVDDDIPQDLADDIAAVVDGEMAAYYDEEETPYIPKKKRPVLTLVIVISVLLALAAGAYLFYTQYYLQTVESLSLSGNEDTLHVTVTSEIDDSLLTVVCADSHGSKIPAPLVNGVAVFTGLSPDSAYTVSVQIDGFHKLVGETSKVYSTPLQTKIAQMTIVTGAESGSVILSFAVEGPDSEQWNVIYSAADEAERVTAFPSHMVTLTDLTVGKEYTFRLEPTDAIYLSGDTEITYVVKNLICAENLHVTACAEGVLTAQWDTPADETVAQWYVRCYNEAGYDETITTTENTVTFENIDDTSAYTVEVTAADMSVNQRVLVAANSVTVSNFTVDTSRPEVLQLSWNVNRDIPANGWTLRYTVNGISAPAPLTVTENSVQIPAIPGGNYIFTLFDDAGNSALGGPFTHIQNNAVPFNSFSVTSADINMRLCKTPSASGWNYRDLTDEDYANSFAAGQKVSIVMALSGKADPYDIDVIVAIAVYNEDNALVGFTFSNQKWSSMWHENYSKLDISNIPSESGTYNVRVFFNGAEAGSQKFVITA